MFDPLATIKADGPDYLNLRKAGRTAIVAPAVLAFGTVVVGNDTLATYSVFAAFVALVFSDYGGPPRRRAGAYLTSIVLGGGAVILGGTLSMVPVAGIIGMFVVMFGATFATVFGGYRALHVAPIALAYSLSVLMPLDQADLFVRVAGWAFGGLVAMIAALMLWPIDRRTGLIEATAELATRLGDVVAALSDPAGARERLHATQSQIVSLQARLSTPLRPSGPATRDIALMELILHLQNGTELVEAAVERGPVPVGETKMASEIVAALQRTRDILLGHDDGASASEAMQRLDRIRTVAIEHVESVAAHEAERGEPVLETARATLPLLAMAHLLLWIEDEALRVMGRASGPSPTLASAPELSDRFESGMRSLLRRVRAAVTLELDPEGVVLRNSIRAGLALATAILLADVLPVEHGFWIALGALGVLRSGASATYATAVEAIAGTVAGFVVAALVVLFIGHDPVLLWILFPIVAAITAFSPGAIHFAVGQAAFTVMVVVLFSILDAPGFRTDVVRVETVSVGAITAAVLSLVLWPRGAQAAVGHALAKVYRAAAAAARTFVTGSEPVREHARADLAGAWRSAEAAFSVGLSEHHEPVGPGAWASILRPPTMVRSLVTGLVPGVPDPIPECRPIATDLERAASSVAARLDVVRAQLDAGSADAPVGELATQRVPHHDAELTRCMVASASDEGTMFQAVCLLAWSTWLDHLESSLDRAQPGLRAVSAAGAPRAWLGLRRRSG